MLWRYSVEDSIRADAWALRALGQFESGKLVWIAWVRRGYAAREEIAKWRFAGECESPLKNRKIPKYTMTHKKVSHNWVFRGVDYNWGVVDAESLLCIRGKSART